MTVITAALCRLIPIALIVMAPTMAKAEPRVLSSAELDSVTAGAVSVQVDASASTIGAHAETLTDARTTAITTPLFDLAYGTGQSRAVACCGPEAGAFATTSAIGQGDVVLAGRVDGEHRNGASMTAASASWVVTYRLQGEGAPLWQRYAHQFLGAITDGVRQHALTTTIGAD